MMTTSKTDARRVGVMHLTDTLGAGGAERVAVNMVNLLPREQYEPHLCTTREDGSLLDLVADDVEHLSLERKQRFDTSALRRLVAYNRAHNIRILHAHKTSLFIAAVASLFPPYPKVVWHDHYGRQVLKARPAWLYRQAARRVNGVIAVNQLLAEWARHRLSVPANRVWYIPNFTVESKLNTDPPALPGSAGGRIVCVANFRPQKDHLTLVRAMAQVVEQFPTAHLLMVGVEVDLNYLEDIRREIAARNLARNVSLLGEQRDVATILRGCDIGVLSSTSEGLPLALLEYGMTGLPTVATKVGQCGEVLDYGRAGFVVPPSAPDKLAEKLLALLRSPDRRLRLGQRFHRRVQESYSPNSIVRQVCRVYDTVMRPAAEGQR